MPSDNRFLTNSFIVRIINEFSPFGSCFRFRFAEKLITMKQITFYAIIGGLFMMMATACAPVYKCGDTVPDKKPGGKRMKAVIAERDVLCTDLAKKENENAQLTSNLNSSRQRNEQLDANLKDLQGRYNKLINESISQSDQFNAALQQKSQELRQQEALLAERERALKEMQAIIA
jgi:chemotaxis protein MotB